MKQQLLSTLGAIVLLDQFTKYLATQAGISHINQGVSWGLISTESQVVLTTAIIFLMIALWLWQKPLWKRYPVVAGLLFGGGISNIIDRILFKGVIDWLPVPGINVSNNIADWSITLALAAILLLELKAHRANKAEKEEIHGD
jgi:signal peptidase II